MTNTWVQRGKQAPGFSRGENCPFAKRTMKDKIIIKAAVENSYNCSESSEFTAADNYITSHDKIILSITKMNPRATYFNHRNELSL
jgi:hypothetical protein